MEVGMLSDYELACRLHKELNGVEVDQQAPGNLSVLSISDDDSELDSQPDPRPLVIKRARSRSPLEVDRRVAIVNQQAITVSIYSKRRSTK
jgi:hypothetical protein